MHIAAKDAWAVDALGLPEMNDPTPGIDQFPDLPAKPPAQQPAVQGGGTPAVAPAPPAPPRRSKK